MTITVEKGWWKTLFDDLYLQTDARSVCNDKLTRQEVDWIIDKLPVHQNDVILDLCGGQGRHFLELFRRGFKRVVLVDYSRPLLRHGHQAACQKGWPATMVQADARWLGFRKHSFKAVLIMGCSFGYFTDESENIKILEGVNRVLNPGGHVLLDLPHRDYVINHFTPCTSHHVDNLKIIRTRELQNNILSAKEEIIADEAEIIRVNHYCTRLYDPETISTLLSASGFVDIQCEPGFMDRSKEDNYGTMTSRMIVTAAKSMQETSDA